jgi:hypothetical protein
LMEELDQIAKEFQRLTLWPNYCWPALILLL